MAQGLPRLPLQVSSVWASETEKPLQDAGALWDKHTKMGFLFGRGRGRPPASAC